MNKTLLKKIKIQIKTYVINLIIVCVYIYMIHGIKLHMEKDQKELSLFVLSPHQVSF